MERATAATMSGEVFVAPARELQKQTITLSPLDQWHSNLRPWRYFCFKTTPGKSNEEILTLLCKGLSYALAEFPDYAGEIVSEPGERGKRSFKCISIDAEPKVRVSVKDLTKQDGFPYKKYEDLEGKYMPPSLLSIMTLGKYTVTEGGPCMDVQANFLEGGLILAVMWHHAVADGVANGNFFKSWAAAVEALSEGETPKERPVNPTSISRNTVEHAKNVSIDQVPMLRKVANPGGPPKPPPSNAKPCSLSIWHLSKAAVAGLKAASSSSNPSDPWITSSDAISALIWRSVAVARGLHTTGRTHGRMYNATNLRARLQPSLPSTHMGNMSIVSLAPVDGVQNWSSSSPLYPLALAIRQAVDRMDDASAREHLGFFAELDDRSAVEQSTESDGPCVDMVVTNLSRIGYTDVSFGRFLGKAQFVRMPAEYGRLNGIAWVLNPFDAGGGFDIMLATTVEAVEKLKVDEEWTRWCEFKCS